MTATNDLELLDRADAGAALGLTSNGLVRRRGVADFYRTYVYARRSVPQIELVGWMTEVLAGLGVKSEIAASEAGYVIDLLVRLGDLSRGKVFGQSMIVPVQPRNVLLPDGRFARLGDQQSTEGGLNTNDGLVRTEMDTIESCEWTLAAELGPPVFLQQSAGAVGQIPFFALTELAAENSNLTEEVRAWVSFAQKRAFVRPVDRLNDSGVLPEQLSRALLLCGECRPDQGQWSINEECAAFLNDWLGVIDPETDLEGAPAIDLEQQEVIESEAHARLLVEAGPGSGKTSVASARLAHLINDDVSPSKIWLLSFTRVAVEELRSRISLALRDPEDAADVKVATFDSFAWRLNAAFSGKSNQLSSSFEQSIQSTILLFQKENDALDDYLSSVEHVVIDEAQDLVGLRRMLVELFLSRLSPDCGVTILGDFAQAIYGFQNKSGRANEPKAGTFLEDMTKHRYQQRELKTDHRTQNPQLTQLFVEARALLKEQSVDPEEKYHRIRSLIEAAATDSVRGPWEGRIASMGNALVLCRWKSGLISAAARMSDNAWPHRLKLSGRTPVIEPWIGALLGCLPNTAKLSFEDFSVVWEDLWPKPEGLQMEGAWNILSKIAKRPATGRLDIQAFPEMLDRSLPISLARSHIGNSGPFFSTIHAAKGLEAKRVMLMMPSPPRSESVASVDFEEEARTLYVGATRAISELVVCSGRGGYVSRLSNGRNWRVHHGNYEIEVGRPGDFRSPVDLRQVLPSNEELVRSLQALFAAGSKPVSVQARRTSPAAPYLLYSSTVELGTSIPLAALSEGLLDDFAAIAKSNVDQLPSTLSGISLVGSSTSYSNSEPNDPNDHCVGLIPITSGFIKIPK